MITELIIEELCSRIQGVSGCIFILKGFAASTAATLCPGTPHLGEQDAPLSKDFVDVRAVEQSHKVLMSALLQADPNATYWSYFEEYLLLSRSFRDLRAQYEGRLVLIENNLFQHEWPVFTDDAYGTLLSALGDYVDSESEEDPEKDISLLLRYYGSAHHRNQAHFVSYVNPPDSGFPDADRIPLVPASGKLASDALERRAFDGKSDSYLVPDPLDQRVEALKLRLFSSAEPMPMRASFFLEQSALRQAELLEDTARLLRLLQAAGCRVSVFVNAHPFTTGCRPALELILKRHWGEGVRFRDLRFYSDPATSTAQTTVSQGILVDDVITQVEKARHGDRRYSDIFVTAPTGAGKSVLFQVPAIYLAETHQLLTIVVTPLKALMFDQVYGLKNRGVRCAACVNSDLSLQERVMILHDVAHGRVHILYVSPEYLLANYLKSIIGDREVGLLVIDEAHLVSTWGRDFRVDYWFLGYYVQRLRRYHIVPDFPVVALTATAVYQGPDDTVEQTILSLGMNNPRLYLGDVRRDRITFAIKRYEHTGGVYQEAKNDHTANRIQEIAAAGKKAIVYFPWISQINDITRLLPEKARRRVGAYYGGGAGRGAALTPEQKERLVEDFRAGRRNVILATKAFGMGVDVPDIEIIRHHATSGSLADYVQEIGRLARDQRVRGCAEIDFHNQDMRYVNVLFGLSAIRQYQVRLMLRKLHEIHRMHGHRNFLISPETFAYLFGSDESLEQRVKSGLLLLQNDLLQRTGYPAIVVRPGSLYTRCFAMVPRAIEGEFSSGRFAGVLQRVLSMEDNTAELAGYVRADPGDTYVIDLKVVWEQAFPDMSFPQLKHLFYKGELFSFPRAPRGQDNVYPRLRLTVQLLGTPEHVSQALDKNLETLREAFSALEGHFFTASDLTSALHRGLGRSTAARKCSSVLLNMFAVQANWGPDGPATGDVFLQRRVDKTSGEEQFRFISRGFNLLRDRVARDMHELFPSFRKGELEQYLPAEQQNSAILKLAYLLEALDLASYEITGGVLPEVFVRINDPYLIQRIVERDDYTNAIVTDIERRHKRAVAQMGYFFTTEMTDQQRWDFIERYFLGRELGLSYE